MAVPGKTYIKHRVAIFECGKRQQEQFPSKVKVVKNTDIEANVTCKLEVPSRVDRQERGSCSDNANDAVENFAEIRKRLRRVTVCEHKARKKSSFREVKPNTRESIGIVVSTQTKLSPTKDEDQKPKQIPQEDAFNNAAESNGGIKNGLRHLENSGTRPTGKPDMVKSNTRASVGIVDSALTVISPTRKAQDPKPKKVPQGSCSDNANDSDENIAELRKHLRKVSVREQEAGNKSSFKEVKSNTRESIGIVDYTQAAFSPTKTDQNQKPEQVTKYAWMTECTGESHVRAKEGVYRLERRTKRPEKRSIVDCPDDSSDAAENFADLRKLLRPVSRQDNGNANNNATESYGRTKRDLCHITRWEKIPPRKPHMDIKDEDLVGSQGLIQESVYQQLQVFKRPQRLICPTQDGSLRLNEETLNEISKIRSRLLVIAVVGQRGQEKSYIMNKLAQGIAGFPVGHSQQPKNKGIWVMCRERRKEPVLMLLETEGVSDALKDTTSPENRMVQLSILMCNVLCFNMFGVSDKDAMKKLQLLSETVSEVMLKNTPRQYDSGLREFLLCVDDFHPDQHGKGYYKRVSGNESFDGLLKFLTKDAWSRDVNDQVFSVKNNFRSGKCFTFEWPIHRNEIKSLDTEDCDFGPRFGEDAHTLVSYIHSKKMLENPAFKGQNGEIFTSFLKCHADAFRCQMEFDVTKLLMKRFEQHNSKLVGRAYKGYIQKLKMIKLPVLCSGDMDRLLSDKFIEMESRDFELFSQLDRDRGFEHQARVKMCKRREKVRKRNASLVYRRCYGRIAYMYDWRMCSKKRYFRSKGHISYKFDMIFLGLRFLQECKDFEDTQKFRAYVTFMKKKYDDEDEIMAEDKRLTNEIENERQRKVMVKRKQLLQSLQVKLYKFKVEKDKMREHDRNHLQQSFHRAIDKKERLLETMKQTSIFCPNCRKWLCTSWENNKTPCY